MNTVAEPKVYAAASGAKNAARWANLTTGMIWLAAVLTAAFFALIVRDSTVIDGTYLPRGNDSFYHARRILDAAVGTRGFYEFDERLHVPDGTWIPWPWAYDFLMAKATQIALWFNPTLDPMAFIAYVPVAWILVNAALFLAVAKAMGLSREMQLLAMLCFALSPLTQLLHAIGMVDHHYVEHTLVLLTAWLGIRWFQCSDRYPRAICLAAVLGLAPAFHNGLFILQLVPLATVFVLWLRGAAPAPPALRSFAITLVAVTQLVLLPSEPYRNWVFEFGLLSWFHLYAACSTGAAFAFMAWRPFTRANLYWFIALCIALAIPAFTQLTAGAGFLAGNFSILDQIVEVRSPYKLFTDTFGPVETASHYSWLLLLAPPLLAYYGWRVCREDRPRWLYYSVTVTFGLALLLDQYRLHYFGFIGLVTGFLLLVDQLRARRSWHRGLTFVVTFAALVLAYQPALRDRLFIVYAPAADTEYASALAIFLDLREMCAEDPGVVLASPDDGSAILFHSECGVIANNFVLRETDKTHIDEIGRLMRLPPAEIRAVRPDVKYVFVRVRDFSVLDGNVARLVAESPIAKDLFLAETPPMGYTLIKTVRRRLGETGSAGVYARLYKVGALPAGSAASP
jgi:hypothetical protein